MSFVKLLHMSSAFLSISGFIMRGLWMLTNSQMRSKKWVKIAPHIIDTVLLLSAIVLMLQTAQYPFAQSWLTAKLIALLAYIGLGLVALRFAKTKQAASVAYVGAIAVFFYIVAVAVQKSPLFG